MYVYEDIQILFFLLGYDVCSLSKVGRQRKRKRLDCMYKYRWVRLQKTIVTDIKAKSHEMINLTVGFNIHIFYIKTNI
jgi:hypothetical protein